MHWAVLALASLTLHGLPPCGTREECDEKAHEIVYDMTTEELFGQMTQLDIATILNHDRTLNETKVEQFAKLHVSSYFNSPYARGSLGDKYGWTPDEWRALITRIQHIHAKHSKHPILYGLDSVHGANFVTNAVIFPHQINAGASFNRDLVRQVGYYTGRDTEAAGIPWIFGPILDVQSAKIWPRVYETFGEDPYLVTEMGRAIVHGLQDNNTIAACFKHFIGYAATPTGHDRDPLTLTDYEVLNYYLPPFKAVIDAGALTGMMNYVSLNGQPMGSNHKMLVDLLRHDLDFRGMLVTDYGVINELASFHHVATSQEDAVRLSLKETSIDMSMVAGDTLFINHTKALLDAKKLTLHRLRQSVQRITALKLQLNLYETPVPGASKVSSVGDDLSKALALSMASESIVLLKNVNKTLPLQGSSPKIFLTGPSIANIGHLCGGWSLAWQGVSGNAMFPHGLSIQDAFHDLCPSCQIDAMEGVNIAGEFSKADVETAKTKAAAAEYTIVVVGEAPYAEKPGDIDDLSLPQGQLDYVKALSANATKLIVVLVQGRPRLLHGAMDLAHAVVNAMLPCELGGRAIVEMLLGNVNPSGKLPFTYPKSAADSGVPYYHRQNLGCYVNGGFGECRHEWPFGFGLSYTSFTYSNLSLATHGKHSLVFGVTVTNDGEVDGKDAVLLYMRQRTRGGNVPEAKRLIHFTKPTIQAKTSTRIHMHVSIHDLSIYVNHIGDGLKRRMVRTTYDFFLVDQHQREVALTWHMDEESSSSSSSWRRRDIDPPWHPPQGLSPARHRQSIFDANFDAATATA